MQLRQTKPKFSPGFPHIFTNFSRNCLNYFHSLTLLALFLSVLLFKFHRATRSGVYPTLTGSSYAGQALYKPFLLARPARVLAEPDPSSYQVLREPPPQKKTSAHRIVPSHSCTLGQLYYAGIEQQLLNFCSVTVGRKHCCAERWKSERRNATG